MRRFFVWNLVLLITLPLSYCAGNHQDAASFAEQNRLTTDTVFVKVDVNNTNKDSLERIYGKFLTSSTQALLDQAEFISAKIRLSIPLYPLHWVSDFENIYTAAEESVLDSIMAGYEAETSNEIAVVSIDSTWTSREDFDRFVVRLHQFWGVGKKENNNGILIGISRGYKIIRISTGLGLKERLKDEEAKKIIDGEMIPRYAANDFFGGTKAGVLAIMKELD